VWIAGDGSAKLAGFDFAVQCEGEIVMEEVVGHPAYRAPEVDEGLYSQAGDLWSLAVCLYEMVYDKLPFGQEPYADEYVEHQTKQAVFFPQGRFANVPYSMREVCHRCLFHRRDVRPSFDELLKFPFMLGEREANDYKYD